MFGLFKNKKLFDDAVQAEVEKREAERKKRAEDSWNKWIEENPVNVNFDKETELRILYTEAEKLYKESCCTEALSTLNNVIDGMNSIEKVIGLYVYILLVDIEKSIAGKEGAIDAYDKAISYYSGVSGEHVDRWRDHMIEAKRSYIKEVGMMERMSKTYNFPLSENIITALVRLEGLKVNEYRLRDYSWQDSFDKVWSSVLHEVDMYEEGEESPLNKTTLKGAKNWLKSFAHLCKEAVPDEYRGESREV